MKSFAYSAAATLLLTGKAVAEELTERAIYERDLCASGSTDVGGNWYCQAVNAITYTGIGHSGSYNQITDMPSSGACSSTAKAYSGNLAPFNEEVSLHFRGPLNLKQLAVYTPSGSAKREEHHAHAERHVHNAEKRAVGDMVTATIDGQIVSWVNQYSGESTTAAAAAAASVVTPVVNNNAYRSIPSDAAIATTAAAQASSTASSTSSYGSGTSTGAWTRQAYYNAANGTSQGLAFLNHFGGTGSGVFDYVYGNSLSYASTSGLTGAASSQVLADTVLPSVAEVIVFTDSVCSGSDCGYVRPGTVAHHGFDGAEKVFLVELSMPDSGETTTDIYTPKNMPAFWMLNAQIPRTLQYGLAACSCWTSGCGEFDILEVLAPGDARCKSTIHSNASGGDSDYFARPTSGTQKVAVIMHNNQFHIKLLDASTDFAAGLDASFINDIVSSTAADGTGTSLFGLAK